MPSSKTKVFLVVFIALLYGTIQWNKMLTIQFDYDDTATVEASRKDPSTTTTGNRPPQQGQETTSSTRDNNDSEYNFERIRLGDYIGDGMVSIAFEVHLDPPPPSTNKAYIMKFTGNYNKLGEYHQDFADVGESVYRITSQVLPPHPSIPRTIWYRKNISNPFKTGLFKLPTTIATETTGATGRPSLRSLIWRLLNSTRTSIAITEYVKATHKHRNSKHILDIPHDKVPCLFRRLFEVLDFIHIHNVQWIDTALWNLILQNGEIVIVDWHNAQIVVDGEEEKEEQASSSWKKSAAKSKNSTTASAAAAAVATKDSNNNNFLPFGYIRLKDGERVHEKDTYTIARRIREFLSITPQQIISNDDRIGGLIDLQNYMSREKPHSMGWLLRHHKYFTSRQNETCSLTW